MIRDHPRVCGEHRLILLTRRAAQGSSPRMRGTLQTPWQHHPEPGIIPAYAGNTMPRWRPWRKNWDHPRVCGEHAIQGRGTGAMWGSSPRMRGTPLSDRVTNRQRGIIPAYAGNTLWCRCRRVGAGDHPRVCGEHAIKPSGTPSLSGSSPRMRGTRVRIRRLACIRGIIPAYAGNTPLRSTGLGRLRDHPRVCGEHFVECPVVFVALGSSPRMRGTHGAGCLLAPAGGIIPAYAGNTPRTSTSSTGAWDHPRVCGEHPHHPCSRAP